MRVKDEKKMTIRELVYEMLIYIPKSMYTNLRLIKLVRKRSMQSCISVLVATGSRLRTAQINP